MWVIMDTVFYVRGSKWVEAEVNAEEKPVREWEVMKGFQSESKQLMLSRTGEERRANRGMGREVCDGQSWEIIFSIALGVGMTERRRYI